MAVRSASLHLALVSGADVQVSWHFSPFALLETPNTGSRALNLLIIPWPYMVFANQFSEIEHPEAALPRKYGFFSYLPPESDRRVSSIVRAILDEASRMPDRVHGIVLPELALTSRQYKELRDAVLDFPGPEPPFLVCGVSSPSKPGKPGTNTLRMMFPVGRERFVELSQHKHHRWMVERSQIKSYGLEAVLSPERLWWESIRLSPRELNFVQLTEGSVFCPLICEDLARQEPVIDLVRAIGPNLVIALLLDGAQAHARWPGRYGG